MYKYDIGESKNGRELYVNLITSSAGHYLSRQPYLIRLIKEVLAPMNFTAAEVLVERDMGRIIGNTNIVTTSEKDSVFYAQPSKKTIASRYVKNRSLTPSTTLTILLVQDTNDNYEIVDTWIGPFCPPFPGDERATSASRDYWETHALVADTEIVQFKTITKVCPY
jgi:hypothetical protein